MILTVCANPSVDSFWSVKELKKGTTNRSRKETFHHGGKGIHTAFALNELDQHVTTLGLWGGQTGNWLRQQCQKKSINTIGPAVEPWNRLCITIKSNSKWNETELLGSGPETDKKTRKSFHSAYHQYIENENIAAVIISGSAPGGFKDDIYYQLTTEAKEHEIPVFVDASGPLLEQTLAAHPFGIHVNQKEGQELCSRKNPVDIVKWISEYCELAAITAGSDGLYLTFRDEIFHAFYKIDDKNIFSTIGSGDCLLAGLCLAYLEDSNPKYWARFATACGSANCLHPQLGMLKAEDVKDILPKVTIETYKM
jgi:1-phosphofructokinase family hexose kinase